LSCQGRKNLASDFRDRTRGDHRIARPIAPTCLQRTVGGGLIRSRFPNSECRFRTWCCRRLISDARGDFAGLGHTVLHLCRGPTLAPDADSFASMQALRETYRRGALLSNLTTISRLAVRHAADSMRPSAKFIVDEERETDIRNLPPLNDSESSTYWCFFCGSGVCGPTDARVRRAFH